jgi:hypothetical protein
MEAASLRVVASTTTTDQSWSSWTKGEGSGGDTVANGMRIVVRSVQDCWIAAKSKAAAALDRVGIEVSLDDVFDRTACSVLVKLAVSPLSLIGILSDRNPTPYSICRYRAP